MFSEINRGPLGTEEHRPFRARNIRYKRLTSGARVFRSTLYRSLKRIALVRELESGDIRFKVLDPEGYQEFKDYCANLDPKVYEGYNEAGLVRALVDNRDIYLRVRRRCRDAVLFRYTSDPPGEWRRVSGPFREEYREAITEKARGRKIIIANDHIAFPRRKK